MQLTDAFCYILLTISVTATCIQAESRRHELQDRKVDKRLNRRDATLLIDSIPVERAFNQPKVIYRRISKHRYNPPKPKYGPPRPKYGPPKTSRKPTKKYKGKVNHKYRPPSPKQRSPKPRYGPPKRPVTKPMYGLPQKSSKKPQALQKIEPMDFGEPPSSYGNNYRSPKPDYDDFKPTGFDAFQKPEFDDFQKPGSIDSHTPSLNAFHKPDFNDFRKPGISDFQNLNFNHFQKPKFNDFQKPGFDGFQKHNYDDYPPNQGYGEPPVDSYGAPLKANLHDLTYSTAQSYPESSSQFDQDTYSSYQSWKSYQADQALDNKYAFSKKMPAFSKPDDVFVTPIPNEANDELGLNSYSDIYNYRQMKENKVKKKPYQNVKMLNKWKGNHKVEAELDDEIIVGGQYAEPPARYVPKFQPSAPMFTDDDDFAPPGSLSDPEVVASATNSPYVNYKNSNMAFSPQNLNDAFSIVDK